MLTKSKIRLTAMMMGSFAVSMSVHARAGLIVSPVTATATSTRTPSLSISNTIDQSGLSTGFTSGVTPFDGYISGNPLHGAPAPNAEWFAVNGVFNATLNFDLGRVFTVSELALWNEESAGIGSMTVTSALDAGFTTGVVNHGSFNPAPNPPFGLTYPAEVLPLTNAPARYFRFNVVAPASVVAVSMGEIAFHATTSDFSGDGLYSCADVDALVTEIASGGNNLIYDLTGNRQVDIDDLTEWRIQAGAGVSAPQLTASGNPVQLGDADLNGLVDGADFGIFNTNKFQPTAEWCRFDHNADGNTDGQDFGFWNNNKFTVADSLGNIPEPTVLVFLQAVIFGVPLLRRR